MMEKKNKEKEENWNMLREDAKRKADVEERRARAEENRAMSELIAVENATMMMNLAEMDEFRLEWWNHAKMEILTRRRKAAHAAMAAMSGARGDDAMASGGGRVDAPATNTVMPTMRFLDDVMFDPFLVFHFIYD
ncbi:hypothetical protein QYE76_008760 [Lolium multiflorum]|uniref:Uncharacterized protein n=1 Tax=Lolium multiflorum TaxID=4521 RepID=A0AAD8TTR6_LOLMU|nr:hypothetical protein QYE76_008760 [Lolium multiflorum]